MYQIWKQGTELPSVRDIPKLDPEFVTVKPFEPEKDGYVFLHGAAITEFRGRMYCAWAHNRDQENSEAEEVNYAVSDDGGKTWSGCICGNLRPENGMAVSHGSFLVQDDSLYYFAPRYRGQCGAEELKLAAYVFDEAEGAFRPLGIVLNERFWPMCEPVLMENGNYLMCGIYVGSGYTAPDNTAAVAISRGRDLLHWDMVKLTPAKDVLVWGECTAIVRGSRCRLFCRRHPMPLRALYAESNDFGKTWSTLDTSDLPMIGSKPYAGTLSTGQDYLICSIAADIQKRDPLTIALTEKGEEAFSRLFTIDEGMGLSYPYAKEMGGKLYVVYSASEDYTNRNAAKLAVIDLKQLL